MIDFDRLDTPCITPVSFNFFFFLYLFWDQPNMLVWSHHQASSDDEENRDCVAEHGNFGVFRYAAKLNFIKPHLLNFAVFHVFP